MTRQLIILNTLFSLLLFPLQTAAATSDIPEPLKPWVPWVLHDQQQRFCTASFDGRQRFCLWPQPLVIDLSDSGGTFSQEWQVKRNSWIFLPGNDKLWPQEVTINGTAALVVNRQGLPAIYMEEPGNYSIAGHFYWKNSPESIPVAAGTGIVQLTIDGKKRVADISGNTLWLSRQSQQEARVEETVQLQVYRLIDDSIPMTITSQLDVQVSGKPREILLDWQLPADQIPLSLQCNLPVKIGADGKIHMQARPGSHTVLYRSRVKGPVDKLTFNDTAAGPDIEYWSFAAQNRLRMVKISGEPPAVDPGQTSIPQKWHSFPAYRVKKGQSLQFETLKRGNPEPPPNNLELYRTFWLDSDGAGITVQETLRGAVYNAPRLVMQPPATLGRMVINDRDQLITRLQKDGPAGVEVRQGQINAMAVSRIEGVRSFPAGGWGQSIAHLSGELVLPPGWTLFHAAGIDRVTTWITRWTLLDCFIVVIIVISCFKLLGIPAGIAALIALPLSYHDRQAPVFIWLALLGSIAVIRALPDSKYLQLIKRGKLALLAVLVIVILPYSVTQLRIGFFPQLEPGISSYHPAMDQMEYAMTKEEAMPASVASTKAVSRDTVQGAAVSDEDISRKKRQREYHFDANAKVQAGPGVPNRKWRSVYLAWNGPVEKELYIKLLLFSPRITLFITLVKVAALFLLTLFMIELKKGGISLRLPTAGKTAAALLCWAVLSGFAVPAGHCASYPDQELLNELRSRLLEPAACFPNCADIAEMQITINGSAITVGIDTAAFSGCAVPIPSGSGIFWHNAMLDGELSPVAAQKETLWLPLPEGRHHITLSGRVNRANIQLQLPRKPHNVVFNGNREWTVAGLDANGVPEEDRLQFIRQKEQQHSNFAASTLPPLMQVTRTLNLGLQWTVETVITRLSPPGAAVFLNIPLLTGEAVTNPGFQVNNGMVMIPFGPNEREKRYQSIFRQQKEIPLQAPTTTKWYEIWRLNASPVWHATTAGIAPILHHGQDDIWQPEWRPWPGEKLTLTVTRPKGVAGPTRAIESSSLTISPGLRSTTMHLSFAIRSTRGGQQHITLPDDAIVQFVTIDGSEQPVKKGNTITIPLNPTSQRVEIEWRSGQGISTLFNVPKIDIGSESVNADIKINIGNRWIWWVKGPQMGPAILFYSEMLIILLVSIILGRSQLTPLRSYHWLILGFGLCQSGFIPCLIIVAWFIALRIRKDKAVLLPEIWFNAAQIALLLLSVVAIGALLFALQNGLLGRPEMLIAGNSSSSFLLRWYQARVTGTILPQPQVLSIPLMAYRITMLAWALWMAFYLLRWVKWGWGCFTSGQIWLKTERNKGKSS